MSQQPTAFVIGSGIAGLAVSIRLAVRGYAVTVFEANDYPGGKLTAFDAYGYRFDAGPSLFTLPALVDELFELANKKPTDFFNYERLDESCRYFWEDGTQLRGWADPQAFSNEVQQSLGEPAEIVMAHLNRAKLIHNTTARIFMEQSLHKAATWLSTDILKALAQIPKLGLFQTMDAANRSRLKHPKLVQLFNRYATYNGSNPYRAPGILNVIPHLEMGIGTYFPKGGMHSITQSVFELAKSLGVTFRFSERVSRIVVKNGSVTGIEANQVFHPSELVISNMDVVPTYRKLLADQPAPEQTLEQERSTSALIFYWGIAREFPELGLHNIFFSDDYASEFSDLFDRKIIGNDPTIYVHISSKQEPTDAPAGHENWFVMVNAPNRSKTASHWQLDEQEIGRVRSAVLKKLQRITGTDIEPHIRSENTLTPADIETRTSSYLGALYGAASNDRMAAFLRHPNFSGNINNLYFCGGSVHPGGGIPLCLLSAKIVDGLVGMRKRAQSKL